MLFDKKDVLMAIMFLVISVNVIAVNGVRNHEVGPSGYAPDSDEDDDENAPEPVYVGHTTCWEKMTLYCDNNNPDANDFVFMAITNLVDADLENLPHLRQYYNSFNGLLNEDKIKNPDEFCEMIEPNSIQKVEETDNNDDDESKPKAKLTKCQKGLKEFGKTKKEAMKHAYFGTKIEVIDWKRMDNPVLHNVALILYNDKAYVRKYLRHIAHHAELYDGYETPLDFCKAYDAQALIEEMSVTKNTATEY